MHCEKRRQIPCPEHLFGQLASTDRERKEEKRRERKRAEESNDGRGEEGLRVERERSEKQEKVCSKNEKCGNDGVAFMAWWVGVGEVVDVVE